MISKSNYLSIAAAATLRNNCLGAGKSWHPRAEGRVCARRLQALRWLHSGPHQGRTLPEADQVRSHRRVPIGVRTKCRPGGQQSQITEPGCPIEGRPNSCANAAETPCEPAIKEITRWRCFIFPRSRRFRDRLPELSRRLSPAG
jgi:hypothetical protein